MAMRIANSFAVVTFVSLLRSLGQASSGSFSLGKIYP
jgi:hypothetical protein